MSNPQPKQDTSTEPVEKTAAEIYREHRDAGGPKESPDEKALPVTASRAATVAWALDLDDQTPLPSETNTEADRTWRARVEAIDDMTELGAAMRFVAQFGDYLLFLPELKGHGRWFVWSPCGDGWVESQMAAERLLRVSIADYSAMIAFKYSRNQDELKIRLGYCASCNAGHRLKAILALAVAEQYVCGDKARFIAANPDRVDADAWALACINGVLDLRDFGFRPHRREDYFLRKAAVIYDQNAVSEILPKILGAPGEKYSQGQLDAMQEYFGSCLVGECYDRLLAYIQGRSGSGKTSIVEGIGGLMGDYAVKAGLSLYVVNRAGKEPESEIARIAGARFVWASECDNTEYLHESRIKDLTGHETMRGRELYARATESKPTAKHVLYGNEKPRVRGRDDAIWGRFLLIEAKHGLTLDLQDTLLQAKFWKEPSERSGLLNWMIVGLKRWKKNGNKVTIPEECNAAIAEYFAREDVLAGWFEDCVSLEIPEATEQRSALHKSHSAWCRENEEKPWSSTAFFKALESRGYKRCGSNGVRKFRGITLRGTQGKGLSVMTRFFEQSLVKSDSRTTTVAEAYDHFARWVDAEGEAVVDLEDFLRQLKTKGVWVDNEANPPVIGAVIR